MALAGKQPSRADSITMATVSSPEIKRIRVINTHQKKMSRHQDCISTHYQKMRYRFSLILLPLGSSVSVPFLLFDRDLKPELCRNLSLFSPSYLPECLNVMHT